MQGSKQHHAGRELEIVRIKANDPGRLVFLEQLEPRLLLTTLVGGDVFEYIDAQGQTIRISTSGDIILELIAGEIDTTDNSVILTDIPGTFVGSSIGRTGQDVLGGRGGADGVELIGDTPISDPDYDTNTAVGGIQGVNLNVPGLPNTGNANINLSALASRNAAGAGATYAFNFGDVAIDGKAHTVAQLVQLDNTNGDGTVRALLQGGTLREDVAAALELGGLGALNNTTAIAVDPTTTLGTTYVINNDNTGSRLLQINRQTGQVTAIGYIAGFNSIQAMSIDQNGNMWALDDVGGVQHLLQINKATAGVTDLGAVQLGGVNFTGVYTDMAFDPADGTLFAVARVTAAQTNAITYQLHRVNTGTRVTTAVGTLTNIDVRAITFSTDNRGVSILVGIDNSNVNGPQMVRINKANATFTAISDANTVADVGGMASFVEPGDTRRTIFAISENGQNLLRGSTAHLAVAATGETTVVAIRGADFHPDSGLLYFVVDENAVDRLYTIDVRKPNRSAIQNSLTLVGTMDNSGTNQITSIAFDNTAGAGAVLYGFRSTGAAGQLITINQATGAVNGVVSTVTLSRAAVPGISGLVFVGDAPNAAENFIYAVDNTGKRFLRIEIDSGLSQDLGPLPDPDDTVGVVRGNDLQGVTYNPTLIDPFTGELGAVIATDATSDELVYIDHRLRPPKADVFAVYVVQSSLDSSFSMAVVPPFDPNNPNASRPMQPFQGTARSLRVYAINPPANTPYIVVNTPSGTGGVYIGAQTEDIFPPPTNEENLLPITVTQLLENLGVRGAGIDDIGASLDPNNNYNLSAGIRVASSLLDFVGSNLSQSLLRNNLDNIQGLAVSFDGTRRVVVDTDRLNSAGQLIRGNEVSVNGSTPLLTRLVSGTVSIPLSNLQGLDFGDVDFNGVEELYAIFDVENYNPVNGIGNTGALDWVAFSASLPDENGNAILYGVANNGGEFDLYRINRNAGGNITGQTRLGTITQIRDGDGGIEPFALTGVNAIETDPLTGGLVLVGTDADGNQALFSLGTSTLELDGVTTAGDIEVLADFRGELNYAGNVKSLAQGPTAADRRLYAVARNGGVDQLIRIANDGTVTVVGTIAGRDFSGIDFNPEGVLFGINRVNNSIETINTNTAVAGTYSGAGVVSANLLGFTADVDGTFYAINNVSKQIFISPGASPTLGVLNENTGIFTPIGVLADDDGTVLSGVQAMAVRRAGGLSNLYTSTGIPGDFDGDGTVEADTTGQAGLFVVGTDGLLYEVDITTGQLLLDVGSGDTASENLGSMDFTTDGRLFAHDTNLGRLVDVDIEAGLGTGEIISGQKTATEAGSLRSTVGAISYDAAANQFLAVDNSTGQTRGTNEGFASESAVLMKIVGLTSTSAQGQNIGRIMIGGTVTGSMYLSGSAEMIYAGWLPLGETVGVLANVFGNTFDPVGLNPVLFDRNFVVMGDLRNLVTTGSIGTHADEAGSGINYITRFDMHVAGKLGAVHSKNSITGSITAQNIPTRASEPYQSLAQREVEARTVNNALNIGSSFENFRLYEPGGDFFNETYDTAERLGSQRDANGGPDVILVQGSVLNTDSAQDQVDYYSVALLAGQTITVQLDGLGLNVGIFDPDRRLVATDYSNFTSITGTPFRFTADRAGEYRIAVAVSGDTGFDGGIIRNLVYDYELRIDGAGDLAIGGIVADSNIWDAKLNADGTNGVSVRVDNGDLGAMFAKGAIQYRNLLPNVVTTTGNLRSVDAGSLGASNGGVAPNLQIASSIGLLRTTAHLVTIVDAGVDVQLVDAGTTFLTNMQAGRGIGVIRAGNMATLSPSTLIANADNIGNDGYIGLIDVKGDLGTFAGGGARISVGLGGNVGYMLVGGDIYQDSFFQTGDYGTLDLAEGENYLFRDDSGGFVNVIPLETTQPTVNANGITVQPVNDEKLTLRTYGIRDSGGGVIVDVVSTGGLEIRGTSLSNGSPLHVGKITANGQGRAVVQGTTQTGNVTVTTNQLVLAEGTVDLKVLLAGDVPGTISAYDIQGGNFTSIINSTGGEIVNVNATTVGELSSRSTIGVAPVINGVALLSSRTFGGGLPFLDEHVGITVTGNLLKALAGTALGNFNVGGKIGTLTANADGVNNAAVFEGINGAIYSTGGIDLVNIGEGVLPSGTGAFYRAGILSGGKITEVRGANADIRGDIISTSGIDAVNLTNGSIINCEIGISQSLSSGLEVGGSSFAVVPGLNLGNITLRGNGGIIGSIFVGANVGNVTVSGGFGIFNALFADLAANGSFGNTVVDGFGIRSVDWLGGGNQGNIIATGRGNAISTLAYSDSVRLSEVYDFDPYFGTLPNTGTDIHKFLGTSNDTPGVTDLDTAGVIEDVTARGSNTLQNVIAYQIRATDPRFPTTFSFINTIRSITTLDTISDTKITTGSLLGFTPGSSVSALDLTVSGYLASIYIRGNLDNNSTIRVKGPNGYLGSMYVTGNFDGDLFVAGRTGSIIIDGNLVGSLNITASNRAVRALDLLRLKGSMSDASFNVDGSVGTIDIAGSLGDADPAVVTDRIAIRGDLGLLRVGWLDGINPTASTMSADLLVLGNVGAIDVTGTLQGNVQVSGNLNSLTVRKSRHAATGGTLVGNTALAQSIFVGGAIYNLTLVGGSLGDGAGTVVNVVAGRDVLAVIIIDGDLASDARVASDFGNINVVQIIRGDLNGDVEALRGNINTIVITGSDFAGHIGAENLAVLNLQGSIKAGATLDIKRELGTLIVRNDVEAGVDIDTGTARMINVGRDFLGGFSTAHGTQNFVAFVGRDLAGDLDIASSATVTVGRNLTSTGSVQVGQTLYSLNVTGDLAGDVLVDGSALRIAGKTATGAVIVTAFALSQLYFSGAMNQTLVQVGVSRGKDKDYITNDGLGGSRVASLDSFSVGNMTNSVVAAGGKVGSFVSTGMVNSSVSSGFSVGGTAISQVLSGALTLTNANLDNVRSFSDRVLLNGDFNSAVVTGTGLTGAAGSFLSAGVDPGVDGIFGTADDRVSSSITAGRSQFNVVRAAVAAGSAVVHDSGILSNQVTGVAPIAVGYSVLADHLSVNNPVTGHSIVGTAVAGTVVNYVTNAGTVKITLTGAGSVQVRDEAGTDTDGIVDDIIIIGTNAGSTVSITGGVSVGRVLMADDTQLASFTSDGALVGDGTADIDLWIEGRLPVFKIASMGDPNDSVSAANWIGRIGGDVTQMTIGKQGPGSLYVGGSVTLLTVNESFGDGLVAGTGPLSSADVRLLSVDDSGNALAYDRTLGTLVRVNLNTGATVSASGNVVDGVTGDGVTLLGMDFASDLVAGADGNLFAVATVLDLNPSLKLANTPAVANLRSVAVNSKGEVFGLGLSAGSVALIKINPSNGQATTVGVIRDVFGRNYLDTQITTLAFDADDNLFVIAADRDGTGGTFSTADGAALAVIESIDANSNGFVDLTSPAGALPAVFITQGGLNQTTPFSAMAVDSTGVIHAVRRVNGGTQDELVTIALNGTLTVVGLVSLDTDNDGTGDQDTQVSGIAFTADDQLLAHDRVTGQVISIDVADPGNGTIAAGGVFAAGADLDGFTVDRSGAQTQTFGFDRGTSSLFKSTGSLPVLGVINANPASSGFGVFTRLQALTQGSPGNLAALSSSVRSLAVDNAGSGDVFVLTQDNRVLRYSAAGELVEELGSVIDSSTGDPVDIASVDFDDATGVLRGVDRTQNRLVSIGLTGVGGHAIATGVTETGTVPGQSVVSITGDFAAGVLRGVNLAANQFVVFADAVPNSGSITASSFQVTTINGAYDGRLRATGNSFTSVTAKGNFSGSLSTLGSITSFVLRDGKFAGTLEAGTDISNVVLINSAVEAEGVIQAGENLRSLQVLKGTTNSGDFAGRVSAEYLGSLYVAGAVTDQAIIEATQSAAAVNVFGNFAGEASLDQLGSLLVRGSVLAGAEFDLTGRASSVNVLGSFASNAVFESEHLYLLNIGGSLSGSVVVNGNLTAARLGAVTNGFFNVTLDTTSVVTGALTNALLSFGTSVGADGVYNTADDTILGGSLASAVVLGDMRDSVIAVGVLPAVGAGPGLPADRRVYTGNTALENVFGADFDLVDSAEAGGILPSNLGLLQITGEVLNTSVSTGLRNVVAVANNLGTIYTRNANARAALLTRAYTDPFGPPSVISNTVLASEVVVTFSEPINTSTLVLSEDANDDGDLDDLGDVVGTITLRDVDDKIYDSGDGIQLAYLNTTDENGAALGQLRIRKFGGFEDGTYVITISGSLTGPAVLDRSGLRSGLRDFDQNGTPNDLNRNGTPLEVNSENDLIDGEDFPGTILDGDNDGIEGGDAQVVAVFGDVADSFLDAGEQPFPLPLDAGTQLTFGSFESATDLDVYRFDLDQFNYLSINVLSEVNVSFALFYRDDQGTVSNADDSFENVIRYNLTSYNSNFAAIELPETGEYYLVVAQENPTGATATYSVELTYSSSDTSLIAELGGSLPSGEVIAYVSNTLGQNNNFQGFNTPKQLVYINFTGGTATDYDNGPTDIGAFDITDLDSELAGLSNVLIEGSLQVNGVIDNVLNIYSAQPASLPGNFNVQRLDASDLAALGGNINALGNGLSITTVDPSLHGLDPSQYSTVYVGEGDELYFGTVGGLLGVASNIDPANMDKSDNAIIFSQNFGGYSTALSVNTRLNEYSRILANVIAHEMGHFLGLNHQPTSFDDYLLFSDDPDNNLATPNDSFAGQYALMAYAPGSVDISTLARLGTQALSPNEFPTGNEDTLDLLLRWLA